MYEMSADTLSRSRCCLPATGAEAAEDGGDAGEEEDTNQAGHSQPYPDVKTTSSIQFVSSLLTVL